MNRRGWRATPSSQAHTTNDRVSELSKARRPDRRRGRADQHHRRPDQPPGAERHHRGGARRRGRPRLCGGRFGGEGARRADRESHRRDRPADHRHPGRDAGSVGAIKEISSTIDRLSEISSAIAAAVEEQGAATQEISRNVQQAAHGTQQVSPTSPTCSVARARPDRPPRRCCPRRNRCPATAAASRRRSASSWSRSARPDRPKVQSPYISGVAPLTLWESLMTRIYSNQESIAQNLLGDALAMPVVGRIWPCVPGD